VNDLPANVAAVTSVSGIAVAWIAQANEVLQFVAFVVSIVAGVYAILHYRKSLNKP
jgi:uncharacterized membrane protein YtjA (UPF0391 family)